MKEVKIEVSGRVQGVNFRNTVKSFADEAGIKGYVMNLDKGSVSIIAQGEKEVLDNFVSWIKGNPGFSKINDIKCEWGGCSNNFSEFRVQREKNFFNDKAGSLRNLFRFFRRGEDVLKNQVVEEEPKKIPVHIAVIPDGNRRWARERGLEVNGFSVHGLPNPRYRYGRIH